MKRFSKTQTGNTFMQWVTNHRNELPENVVSAPSTNTLKESYDNHMAWKWRQAI